MFYELLHILIKLDNNIEAYVLNRSIITCFNLLLLCLKLQEMGRFEANFWWLNKNY